MKHRRGQSGWIAGWLLLLVLWPCLTLAAPLQGHDYLVAGAPTSEQTPARRCTPEVLAGLDEQVEIPPPPGGWSGAPQAVNVFNIFAGEVRVHHGDREVCGRMHDARTRDSRFRAGVGMVVVPQAGDLQPIRVAWAKPLKADWIPTVRIGAPSPVQQIDTARLLVRTACLAIAIALALNALMGFLSARDALFLGYALLCAVAVVWQAVLSGLSGYPEPWLPVGNNESRWLVAFYCMGPSTLLYVLWTLVGGTRLWPRSRQGMLWVSAACWTLGVLLAVALPMPALGRFAQGIDLAFTAMLPLILAVGALMLGRRHADAAAGIAALLPFLAMGLLDLVGNHVLVEYRIEAIQLSITWFLSVTAYVVNLRLGRLRRQRDEMQTLADTDALTGLPNRRSGLRRLEQHLQAARTDGTALAVGFLDIDLFKRINDVHGHAAGDRVLMAVAQTLTRAVRDPADIIRMGGEEFLVMLPGVGAVVAKERLEAMRRLVAVTGEELGIAGLALTASIGMATLHGDDIDAASLLRRADEAMYAAKRGGRNRVVEALPLAEAVS